MLASHLPPSFPDAYSLSTSSLGCNSICMAISFLILRSICLSSSLVNFKKVPNIKRGMHYYFDKIGVVKFYLSSFLVLHRYFIFDFLFHFHLFDGVNPQDAQVLLRFLLFKPSNIVLVWYFPSSVRCRFPLFITSIAHFSKRQIPFLCSDYIF